MIFCLERCAVYSLQPATKCHNTSPLDVFPSHYMFKEIFLSIFIVFLLNSLRNPLFFLLCSSNVFPQSTAVPGLIQTQMFHIHQKRKQHEAQTYFMRNYVEYAVSAGVDLQI